MENRAVTLEQRRELEIHVLRQKASEAEKLARELESTSISEDKRMAQLLDKLKDTYGAATTSLERQLHDNNDSFRRLDVFSRYTAYSPHSIYRSLIYPLYE